MSSSRGFVRIFAGLAGTGVLAALALTLAVDPYGAIAPAFGLPSACAPGIKSGLARQAKVLVPAMAQPRTIVMGTSRVMLGFDQPALALLGPRGVNLGVENAQPRDFLALAHGAGQWSKVETVYIGIDYTSFYGRETPPLPEPAQPSVGRRTAVLAGGLFSIDAVRAALLALRDCSPRFAANGAPAWREGRPVWLSGQANQTPGMVAIMAGRTDGIATGDALRQRESQFRATLALWRRHGARTVVFVAPYDEAVREHLEAQGQGQLMARWLSVTAAIAQEEGAEFADFTSQAAIAALGIADCPDGGIGCHFYDHIHYDNVTGRALAEKLAAIAENSPG